MTDDKEAKEKALRDYVEARRIGGAFKDNTLVVLAENRSWLQDNFCGLRQEILQELDRPFFDAATSTWIKRNLKGTATSGHTMVLDPVSSWCVKVVERAGLYSVDVFPYWPVTTGPGIVDTDAAESYFFQWWADRPSLQMYGQFLSRVSLIAGLSCVTIATKPWLLPPLDLRFWLEVIQDTGSPYRVLFDTPETAAISGLAVARAMLLAQQGRR